MDYPDRIYPLVDRALLEPLGMMVATCNHVEFYLAYGYWLMHGDERAAYDDTMRKACNKLRRLYGDAFKKFVARARGTLYEPEALLLDGIFKALNDDLESAFEDRNALVHCAWVVSGRGDAAARIDELGGVVRMVTVTWTASEIEALTDRLAALASRTLEFVNRGAGFAARLNEKLPPATLPTS